MPDTTKPRKTIAISVIAASILMAGCESQQENAVAEVHCSHEDLVIAAAGEGAIDCGFAHPGWNYDFGALDTARAQANACVEKAFEAGKPFHARYWFRGIGYEAGRGYASPGGRIVSTTYYGVFYDHNRKVFGQSVLEARCDQPVLLNRAERWHGELELFDCDMATYDPESTCQASGRNPPTWPTPWTTARN